MRDVNIRDSASNNVIDNSVSINNYNSYVSNSGATNGVPISLDRVNTELSTIVKKECAKVAYAVLSALCSIACKYGTNFFTDSDKIFDTISLRIFLIALCFIFAGAGVLILLTVLVNLCKFLSLRKEGKLVTTDTPVSLFSKIIAHIKSDYTGDSYSLSNLYKNEKGVILSLKGCTCPICQSAPKGYMSFRYDPHTKSILLTCNEEPKHELIFDHKIMR